MIESTTNISPAVGRKFREAMSRLKDAGFILDPEVTFPFFIACECFNKATLWKVFALGQILKKEQPLTVRGAFYRAVSAGVFPDTRDKHYRACKRLILDMRRACLIPYSYISDSTRRRLKPNSWSGLADYAQTVAEVYRKDLWARQSDYIEFFVEKDAMAGVIQPVTDEHDVWLNVIRGNCSETFIYNVAEHWREIDKPIKGYYLGDHDPNGLKIEHDLKTRIRGFCDRDFAWQRLAVTGDDFADTSLLGFPVKRNGPKGNWQPYIRTHGDRCVEVDAIPSSVIRRRVQDAILSHIDQREWQFLLDQEEREKADVLTLVKRLGAAAAA
jgi:hypothetical protein